MRQILHRLALLAYGLSVAAAWQGAPNTEYEGRGYNGSHYKEGTKPSPSSGHANLYLISATVDYGEKYSKLPAAFRAGFYLPPNLKSDQVFLTIRELDPHYYYWLDEVRPQSGWRTGTWNKFEWPTTTVVQFLTYKSEVGPLGLSQLAAAARLEPGTPGKEEKVAPVALYYFVAPRTANGYQFVFHPDRKMHLTFKMLREGSQTALETQPFPSVLGQEPLPVKFDATGWTAGWYVLSVKGYSEDAPVDEAISFYHSPQLER